MTFYVFLRYFLFVTHKKRKWVQSTSYVAGICNARVPHTTVFGADNPPRATDFGACAPLWVKTLVRKSFLALDFWFRGAWSERLAWPRIWGYLESKNWWSRKPAHPSLNSNPQVVGELTEPFRGGSTCKEIWFVLNWVDATEQTRLTFVPLEGDRPKQASVWKVGREQRRRLGIHIRIVC